MTPIRKPVIIFVVACGVLLLARGGIPTAHADGDERPARLLPLAAPPAGLSFSLTWDADIFANLDGGIERGYATDSLITAGMSLDTGEFGWWQGGTFSLSAQAIASTHPSQNYVGDLQTVSKLDAPNARRIAQLWYAQSFGSDILVRAGIIGFDSFFGLNPTAGLFTNASYGFIPTMPANAPLPGYPNSGWGIMARLGQAHDKWLIGVFQGDPVHRSSALERGATLVAERDWKAGSSGPRLGIGAWYRHAPAIASPTSDWGAYANLEQPLPGNPDVVLFAQLGASPGDVNEVPYYLGGGVRFSDISGPISDIGLGFARVRIRERTPETSLEASVSIPLFDGAFTLYPDLQYVLHPSGIHPNALVIGLRLHAELY